MAPLRQRLKRLQQGYDERVERGRDAVFGAEADDDAVARIDLHRPARETISQNRVHGVCRATLVALDDLLQRRIVNHRACGASHRGAFPHQAEYRGADLVAPGDAGGSAGQRKDRAATIL